MARLELVDWLSSEVQNFGEPESHCADECTDLVVAEKPPAIVARTLMKETFCAHTLWVWTSKLNEMKSKIVE